MSFQLSAVGDRGQTDRVTAPTRAGLHHCRYSRPSPPRHTARLGALVCSWWLDSKHVLYYYGRQSVLNPNPNPIALYLTF